LLIINVTAAVIVITNVTAIPILTAESTFFETPTNGQIPRNCARTKLFTMAAEIKIVNRIMLEPSLHCTSLPIQLIILR